MDTCRYCVFKLAPHNIHPTCSLYHCGVMLAQNQQSQQNHNWKLSHFKSLLLIKLVACNVVESCRHQLGNTVRIKKNCLTINNYAKMWGVTVSSEVTQWPYISKMYYWVTVSKPWNANIQLNIKALGEKELDSEHFVMIWLSDWKQEWVEHGTLACGSKEYIVGCL